MATLKAKHAELLKEASIGPVFCIEFESSRINGFQSLVEAKQLPNQ
jgi:hypothetical protein